MKNNFFQNKLNQMFQDKHCKNISESNNNIDSSKFLKVLTELLENEVLTSFTAVETDLDSCISSIVHIIIP